MTLRNRLTLVGSSQRIPPGRGRSGDPGSKAGLYRPTVADAGRL
jgi:hypothetical protein